uniref:Myosin motor domain-containing protein n=1 Tax=Brugia timori TaxID=42155 RepID=A0A0R3RAB4_9BILA
LMAELARTKKERILDKTRCDAVLAKEHGQVTKLQKVEKVCLSTPFLNTSFAGTDQNQKYSAREHTT